MSTDDDWQEVWDARADALSAVLGECYNQVYHAPLPFALGGNADVLSFAGPATGVAYVTGRPEGVRLCCL